ncbi:MAG: hypothetical protein JWR60_4113 [Polaromonas sp.]|nr:hypothetical protein [Polaromonas sp.]
MSHSPDAPDRGVPLGDASPDEQVHTLPAEPSHVTPPKESSAQGSDAVARPAIKKPGNEEPELALEPDLPTDGRDEIGEQMIRDLPARPELSDAPTPPG